MRLKELDDRLATLQSQIQFATENILELSELPLCKQLRAELEAPQLKLCGLTRDCACAVLADIDQTLQWILLIKAALERAAEIRQALWMTQETKAHELDQLLSGASIQLPTVATPVLGRSLTGPAEQPQYASISELQARMASGFESAKRTFLTLQAARDTNEKRLARSEQEVAALERVAAELNYDDRAWADALHATCAELRQQLETDPLHVSEAVKRELEPGLKNARRTLRELSEQRTEVSRSLQLAAQHLEDLIALQTRAAALRAERAARLHTAATPLPLPAPVLGDLRQWLAALQQGMPAQWQAVRTGLQKWMKEVERAQAHEREVVKANQRPLEQFTALRERFAAARAHSASSSEETQQLFTAAEHALRARPARLDVCAKLVHACEQASQPAQPVSQRT